MKYACQNKTQLLFDHMYPIPEYFEVDPKYLLGLNENEFIEGLRCFWDILRDMYTNIINDPELYGLPCVEDINQLAVYPGFDQKCADSGNSSRRLMEYLCMICRISELKENNLVIPFNEYDKNLKILRPKVTNAASYMLINRLEDFGFKFTNFNGKSFDKGIENFIVSYAYNKNLIPALIGYSKIPYRKEKFCVCHYDAVALPDSIPQPLYSFVFSQYFSGKQKDFFIEFNKCMLEADFICEVSPNYPFVLEYYRKGQLPLNKDKPFIVRCLSDSNQLDIIIKMMDIASYSGYIESLPNHIKSCYKVARCRGCVPNPQCGIKWTIDGETFRDCQWGNGAHISEFNLTDIETYIEIIKMEAKAKRYR